MCKNINNIEIKKYIHVLDAYARDGVESRKTDKIMVNFRDLPVHSRSISVGSRT